MDITVVLPGVVHLSFPNRKEMTLSLCRAQEFYEASDERLRGRHFTWEAFVDAFTDDEGKISYFSFWSGFNFPGTSYSKFLDAFKLDLSDRETRVMEAVTSSVDMNGSFYVIGTLAGAEDTFRHETLHALYHVDDAYRTEATGLVLNMDHGVRTRMREGLARLGYGDNVIYDEIQAYLGSGGTEELARRFGLTPSESAGQGAPFQELAGRFLPRN